MKIKSAQYQRNGVTGRPFYAAIIEDPFGVPGTKGQDFLVISLDEDGKDRASLSDTFVVSLDDLRAGKLAEKWRGDRVTLRTLDAIRKAAAS